MGPVWFRSAGRIRREGGGGQGVLETAGASQSRCPANGRTVCLGQFCVARTEHSLGHL